MYKILLLYFFSLSAVLANQTSHDFEKFKGLTKSLESSAFDQAKQFRPETIFKGYSENPKTQNYYKGIKHEKDSLNISARREIKNDRAGQTIIDNFGKYKYEINKKNETILQAKVIEDESYSIVHGNSTGSINCEDAKKQCAIKHVNETCYTSRKLPAKECKSTRKITVKRERTDQKININIAIPKKWTGAIAVNLRTGAVSGGAGGQVSSTLKLFKPCAELTATVLSLLNNGSPAYWVSITQLPGCSNGGVIYLYISKKFKRNYLVQVALSINAVSKPFISNEEWVEECQNNDNQIGICHKRNESCVDSNPIRMIDGLKISRPCWEKTSTYSCVTAKTDECEIPKYKGCMQIHSKCIKLHNGSCMIYEQTYRCEKQNCHIPIACLKNLYCVDGDCVKTKPSESKNFGKDVSALAALSSAGEQYKQGNLKLFSGNVARCKIWPLNVIDCCSDKGWGEKLNLVHCRDEDKALGQAKLDYKVHYLGKYCSKKELGVCIEHKRTYCVFNSKLARIIHEEGRLKQIGTGALGTARNPNCGGITAQEFESLDLGQIDFVKPVYPYGVGKPDVKAGIANDLAINNPNNELLVNKTTQRIKDHMEDSI